MKSLSEFREYQDLLAGKTEGGKSCLVVCAGTGGRASGSNDILRIIKRQILERGLSGRISLRITGCLGFCEMDPFLLVEPRHTLYPKLSTADIPRIIDAVLEDDIVDDLVYREPGAVRKCRTQSEIPFFAGQTRTILGDNQRIDPIRIADYVRIGGYRALMKVLGNPDPEWIIREIAQSGLRGRGGAGFPTGKKWELARKTGTCSTQKYLVCNADEGDPGAYMDRSMLEGNPHAILEGMIIAGVAIGATQGIIYVRSEYPLAIKHSSIALQQARTLGLLGNDILGTGLSFNIEIVRGAGAFVCGEETALIRSIEGTMGEPRQRPPYPITKGIFGCPTCINNVETLANVPVIIAGGASAYAKTGIESNRGTKIFSLVGKIKNTGLVEVPLGTPLKKVLYDIGGGPAGNAKIKAIQTGGPSGGCIPASLFDLPIGYDSLTKAGSIMGSGGMIVMDHNTCMVDVARYFMNFLKEESCGKCFTCRKGTQRMHELLDDIAKGQGTPAHLDLLEELAHTVKDTTMCGLGQSAPNPVLSTLRYFRKEYERHIIDKKCDAFVCKELVGAPCQAACPVHTEPWRYAALIEKGEFEEAYKVIREANPFPSVCARACDHKCESRCNLGVSGGEPVAVRALKRFVVDTIDPAVYRPLRASLPEKQAAKVAVIGAGPAGLTAAYFLSLAGYAATVFEAEDQPGGMLLSGLPAYRMPAEVVRKEIQMLLNADITLKCNTALGRDFTLDDLFKEDYRAVFLSIGAHESQRLGMVGEDSEGIYSSMDFLKGFNLRGQEFARGRVGVIGGGNSAVDAARVALRQKNVDSVTLLYRRTRSEMPAFEEEIEAALEEGVSLETLISPVAVQSKDCCIAGVTCIRNELGDVDASGRRKPEAIPGSEFALPFDTLIIAIGERPQSGCLAAMGLEVEKDGRLRADPSTGSTSRRGVFAGGDLVTGPNTIIDAIAAGKNAAAVIGRYLRDEPLKEAPVRNLPKLFIEPVAEPTNMPRSSIPVLPPEKRRKNFHEIERPLSLEGARQEARRCLRCDLEFTRDKCSPASAAVSTGGEQA